MKKELAILASILALVLLVPALFFAVNYKKQTEIQKLERGVRDTQGHVDNWGKSGSKMQRHAERELRSVENAKDVVRTLKTRLINLKAEEKAAKKDYSKFTDKQLDEELVKESELIIKHLDNKNIQGGVEAQARYRRIQHEKKSRKK